MTSIFEDIFGDILSVRRKRNSTKNLLSRTSRAARGVPEVMVKITGFGKSTAHIQSHFDYISRKGDVSLETDTGEHLGNREDIEQYFEEWQEKAKTEQRRQNRRETLHLVLSMPAHVDSESVRQASRSFARDVFGNHEYAFALHTDSRNPHCHLVIRMTDRDGSRINPKKADLQHWREVFAEKVREQGYEAEATSRKARGIIRKRVKSPVWHMTAENNRSHPYRSGMQASRIHEASFFGRNKPKKQLALEKDHLSSNVKGTLSSRSPAQSGREQQKQDTIQHFDGPEEIASFPPISEKEITERTIDLSKRPKRDLER